MSRCLRRSLVIHDVGFIVNRRNYSLINSVLPVFGIKPLKCSRFVVNNENINKTLNRSRFALTNRVREKMNEKTE